MLSFSKMLFLGIQVFTAVGYSAGRTTFEFLPVDETFRRNHAQMLAPGCLELNESNQRELTRLARSFVAFTPRSIWRDVGVIHTQFDPNNTVGNSDGSRTENPFVIRMRVCNVLEINQMDAVYAHEFAHGIFRFHLLRRGGQTEYVGGINELWGDFFAAAWANNPSATSDQLAALNSDESSASMQRELRRFVNNTGPTAAQRTFMDRNPLAAKYFLTWEVRNKLWSKYQERIQTVGATLAMEEIFDIFMDIAADLSVRAETSRMGNVAVTNAMIPTMNVRLDYLGVNSQ